MAYVETGSAFSELIARVKAKRAGVSVTTAELQAPGPITAPMGPRRTPPPTSAWYLSPTVMLLGVAAVVGGFFFFRRGRKRGRR